MISREERVNIFLTRFKGRGDVFARRWQKWDSSISGYAPVYTDYKKKSYEPYTAEWAEKHLLGSVVLGVYPLLQDNTSHFIAADFDGEGCKESVRALNHILHIKAGRLSSLCYVRQTLSGSLRKMRALTVSSLTKTIYQVKASVTLSPYHSKVPRAKQAIVSSSIREKTSPSSMISGHF